ncbi:MAG: ATP-dependent helicase [Oscillospiraceae bacterium]|nr:ATP-dependent helicase [Oscillospiraceae bacterium]
MLDIETLKKELDSDQFTAVTAPLGNMLCIANAGSGKTRVLTYRIAYLISQGEPESSFLMLTFTVKAANEMMLRIQKLLGKSVLQITGGTFHSVAIKFVKKFANLLGYHKKIKTLDAQDSAGLMTLARMYYCAFHDIAANTVPPQSALSSAYSYCRNTNQNVRDYILEQKNNGAQFYTNSSNDVWANVEAVEGIIQEYESRKKAQNALDFDDMLHAFDKLLDFPAVQDYIHSNLPNVFVDEYQDINAVQDSIIRKLNDKVNRLTAVGDDAQCIYGFRGSEVKFIQDFKNAYPNASICPIRNNYRSTDGIVDLALAVINENSSGSHKEMNATQTSKRIPYFKGCLSEKEQADYITQQVKDAHARGIPYDEMAVLCRTRRLPHPIEVSLTNAKIPVCMECGIPFYERAHVRPVLNFLKFLDNHQDEVAFWKLAEMTAGIGPKKARDMFKQFEAHNFDIQTLSAIKISKKSSGSFRLLIETILQGDKILHSYDPSSPPAASKQSLLQILANLFCDQWLYCWMKNEFEKGDLKNRRADIKTLLDALSEFNDIDDFLETVALADDKTEISSKGKVKITTIHRAKGLEWDKVFVPYLNDQLLPFYSVSGLTEKQLEEERRLCYVAVTRARKELDLSSVAKLDNKPYFKGNLSTFMIGAASNKYVTL